MTRYADPSVCPDCRAPLPAAPTVCPSCGLPLQGPLAVSLFRTLSEADKLLADLRTSPATAAVTAATVGDAVRTAAPAPTSSTAPPTPAGPPPRTGVRGISVATILLGLGALCLLVAAVIFLAVAWSWLGVGGRTAVLLGLTVASGWLAVWLDGRGLRVAAEALVVVSLGLLALDVTGADNAGWLGDLSTWALVAVVGAAVLVASLGLLLLRPLVAPQVTAALGLWAVGAGVVGLTTHDLVVNVLAVLGFAGLAAVGRAIGVRVLPWASLLLAAGWWLSLLGLALDTATTHPSVRGLWLEGHGLGLVAASALLLLPLALTDSHGVRRACVAAAATLATPTVAFPALDEGVTPTAVVFLVLLVLWCAAAVVVPESWRVSTLAPLGVSAVPVAAVTVVLVRQAVGTTLSLGEPWTRSAAVRLASTDTAASAWLLLPAVLGLLLAAATVLPGTRRSREAVPVAAVAVALAAVATLALHPVPLWTVTGSLGLVAMALVADALRREDLVGAGEAAAGGVLAAAAAAAALPSAVLTTVATAVLVAAAAVVAWRGRFPEARRGAWLVLPLACAGLLWSAGEVAGVDEAYRAVPVLLVVGAMAVLRPRPETELAAAAAGLLACVEAVGAASDPVTSLSVHLTVAGVLVTTSALVNPTRRELGWLGGLLLAAATWVRLAEIGVETPEAYTLPSAVALLLVGLRRLRVDPRASTLTALGPGLLLGTTPSLLWVLAGDVVSLRALLLGAGCLGLVLAGVRLRWNAPLLVGAGVGAALVLRELAPYAGHTPQWVLIGLAGTALILVGVTWERRMLEVRHAAAYVGRLR